MKSSRAARKLFNMLICLRLKITALFRLPLNTLITVALLSGLSAKGSLAFGICGLSLLCCILVLPALNHRRPNDVGQTSD